MDGCPPAGRPLMDAHEGGCLGGAVRYRVTSAPQVSCYCCCATCQGATGAPAVSWIAVEDAGFDFEGRAV